MESRCWSLPVTCPNGCAIGPDPRGLLHESPDPGIVVSHSDQGRLPTDLSGRAPGRRDVGNLQPPWLSRGDRSTSAFPPMCSRSHAPPFPCLRHAAVPHPDGFDISRAADMLNGSSRPLIWVGGGAVASGAAQGIDALTWRLGAPALCTYAGRGVLPTGHPLLIDAPPQEPLVRELLAESDVLLMHRLGAGRHDHRKLDTSAAASVD